MPRDATNRTTYLSDRLMAQARQLREQAAVLPAGADKEALLQKAKFYDNAGGVEGWLRSAELRPPE